MENTFVSLHIVQRNFVQINKAVPLGDQLQGIINDGERGEPQEVHLQQAHFFDRLHVIGGHDFIVFGLVKRNKFFEWLRRNHYSGCMDAGIPHQSFQL